MLDRLAHRSAGAAVEREEIDMSLAAEAIPDLILVIDPQQRGFTRHRQGKFGLGGDAGRFKDRFDHIEQVEKDQQQSHQDQDTPGGDTDTG